MHKSLIFISLLLVFQTACSHPEADGDATVDTITVSGLGEVEVKSDQATLAVEISAENKEMAVAKSQADAQYQAFLDLLDDQDMASDELTLTQLNMNPVYEWRTVSNESKRFQTGFRVSRNLSFELNELDKLPDLLEALANTPAIEVNSITRGLQNPSAVIEQATAKAADDAKRRAAFIAAQFDRSLGDVKSVQAHHSNVPFAEERSGKYMAGVSRMADSAPQEHLGSQKVTASLNVVYKLK